MWVRTLTWLVLVGLALASCSNSEQSGPAEAEAGFGLKGGDGAAAAVSPSVQPPNPERSAENAPSASARLSALSTAAPSTAALSTPDAGEQCPADMLRVEGEYCPYVGHRCVEWLNRAQGRCARFDRKGLCEGRLERRSFCIDRFEFPNQKGVLPVVMVSFIEAQTTCHALGKRLCRESEWNFACEGNERVPYPYGYERDSNACNIDRKYRFPDFDAFDVDSKIAAEVESLDQRVTSGSMAACKSPFGVSDLTGNVDEWVINESGKPYKSGLKGGYWGPIRARCRPMTTFHNEWFRFYQVGFRCCADPS